MSRRPNYSGWVEFNCICNGKADNVKSLVKSQTGRTARDNQWKLLTINFIVERCLPTMLLATYRICCAPWYLYHMHGDPVNGPPPPPHSLLPCIPELDRQTFSAVLKSWVTDWSFALFLSRSFFLAIFSCVGVYERWVCMCTAVLSTVNVSIMVCWDGWMYSRRAGW
jgi:hypothetical protein